MKKGQLKVWWNTDGIITIDKEVDSLLEALWLVHTQSVIEVNNESISFNMSTISYFDEEYLKDEYDCEDGFSDLYLDNGEEVSDLLTNIYNDYREINDKWYHLTKEQIKAYLIDFEVRGEIEEVVIY